MIPADDRIKLMRAINLLLDIVNYPNSREQRQELLFEAERLIMEVGENH